jgi:dynein heavy chain
MQNCHLAKSWLSQLAVLVEQLEAAAASTDTNQQLHPSFRLWLTTAPVDYFPTALLHKGVRAVLEPPRGFKQGLLRGYQCLPRGCLAACNGSGGSSLPALNWQQQLFAMAVLHSLVQERRRFGALGWNIQYEFSDSDLSCAVQNMQMIVEHQAGHGKGAEMLMEHCVTNQVMEVVRHIVCEVVYGGRVTDANDWQLLEVLVRQHLPWQGPRQHQDQEQGQELKPRSTGGLHTAAG